MHIKTSRKKLVSHYIGPILPASLADLAAGRRPACRSAPKSNDGGSGNKNPCPRWRPRGAPHELRCAMTCTFPPCPFGMGRTRDPFFRGWSYPPCTSILFERTGICTGCAGSTVIVKTHTSPPPLRWHPPSPGYLKWIGGDDRYSCSLATAGRITPPTPRPCWD